MSQAGIQQATIALLADDDAPLPGTPPPDRSAGATSSGGETGTSTYTDLTTGEDTLSLGTLSGGGGAVVALTLLPSHNESQRESGGIEAGAPPAEPEARPEARQQMPAELSEAQKACLDPTQHALQQVGGGRHCFRMLQLLTFLRA